MARMHSRAKGKSGSTRPIKTTIPSWVRYKPKEVELLVAKLRKEKHEPSQIGIVLRDIYGIPSVKLITKKSINNILKEKELLTEIPEDLMNLMKKNIELRRHMEENKKDMVGKRGIQLTESKIKRLIKYYKKSKRLSEDWSYDPEKVRLLID
ncbi:30S ribosomal protein S15 [Candidatus Woesearchaeota archaeon]|jgi:small subunit ribosomal protein S15|nr:30S ribosomal protein S15 [Candidatus Woesearchaeota archaeon]MBT5272253.1 30S ribosomal protein S15 [Candidatus Woesearchaeota archaeon]MBT6041154.1 30S ribosomal protein S15 [Candidatus Woesearchaeota archaeon]MBT6336525.1 30S ribosomal protein S15 [Candidatus Woesearchaeota archaeon]MBT7927415.1 30S ribosomal protein S15 [Candidatus Woesearchaeota archaeon]